MIDKWFLWPIRQKLIYRVGRLEDFSQRKAKGSTVLYYPIEWAIY